ncbi:MAG: cysteine desulfurase family protein [Pseudomonadota bacterium]
MSRVYLDHNATAPLRPEARAAMVAALDAGGNASSVHAEGRKARALVEEARSMIAEQAGATVNGVVFTSGGTEADNLAIRSAVASGATRIFLSAIEHDAVRAPAASLAERGDVVVETIPVLETGVVDLDWLERRLEGYNVDAEGAFLLCIMLANNETGVVQPAARASDIARAAGGRTLVDACQAFGKIPVDFIETGAEYMSLSAHKLGGPLGAGALLVKPELSVEPLLRGGGQELRRRAGTENAPAIAGFAAATKAAAEDGGAEAARGVRDAIEAGLSDLPGVRVWGADANRLPGTLALTAEGFSSETQVMTCDLGGVAVSAGAACSSGKVARSAVLQAMGASEEEAECGLRVSAGWSSEAEDADAFLQVWRAGYARVTTRRNRTAA